MLRFDVVCVVSIFIINKLSLMHVSRGNILKTTGMLCNPKFIYKNNQHFSLGSTYFLYPLTSLPKMVKQEIPASTEQG